MSNIQKNKKSAQLCKDNASITQCNKNICEINQINNCILRIPKIFSCTKFSHHKTRRKILLWLKNRKLKTRISTSHNGGKYVTQFPTWPQGEELFASF